MQKGFLHDFCDGSLYKEHPLFSSATESDKTLYLQFVLYYDDVETNNPLGSHRGKHKLGISNIEIYCHVFTMCEYSFILLYTG